MRIVILGSGIVGLLAKEAFADAEIIPFGRSRFYFFRPALSDDFIACGDKIDDFVRAHLRPEGVPLLMKRLFSVGGALVADGGVKEQYLGKVYGQFPNFALELLRTEFFTYPIRLRSAYHMLLQRHSAAIGAGLKLGPVRAIRPGSVVCEGGSVTYDLAVSTIPLGLLQSLVDQDYRVGYPSLRAHDETFYHIKAGSVNLEGADQVLVADPHISFHRVDRLGADEYLFHAIGPIEDPLQFFRLFMPGCCLAASTSLRAAVPCAPIAPDLQGLMASLRLACVGASAQWDPFMDAASVIVRLQRLRHENG
jgi:hypothetical protein